jgi:hypothetical protein
MEDHGALARHGLDGRPVSPHGGAASRPGLILDVA